MKKLIAGRWSQVLLLFLAAAVPLFLFGCGSNKTLPDWNITGTWYTYYATSGTTGELGPSLYTFTTSTNSISGATDQKQPITGEITGLDITFSYVQSDGTTNNSTGAVGSDGTTMSGNWTDTKGQSGTWHAILHNSNAATINVAGNWNTYQTTTGVSGEQGPNPFTFTQSGDVISGTTSEGPQFAGSISFHTITFFLIGTDGVTTNTFTGTVNADGLSMSGTWINTRGQSGTWRAVKIN